MSLFIINVIIIHLHDLKLLGNQATLFCSVSGTPSPTNIYWEKKQNDGSYTTVDVSGNSRYSGGSHTITKTKKKSIHIYLVIIEIYNNFYIL
jgi:hypothetical protein